MPYPVHMSDPLASPDTRPLRIAGRGEVHEGEVQQLDTRRAARPLRAPAISGAALVQMLFALLALAGLFVVVAEVASAALASGVCALVAGVGGVVLSALREAGRI